ncbi:MAG TPA: hypothetical protein VJ583_03335 [Nitrososphaeraceae archaeon]|nr:hypothetical protein [Nitrososphaeraceae archaeon]
MCNKVKRGNVVEVQEEEEAALLAVLVPVTLRPVSAQVEREGEGSIIEGGIDPDGGGTNIKFYYYYYSDYQQMISDKIIKIDVG